MSNRSNDPKAVPSRIGAQINETKLVAGQTNAIQVHADYAVWDTVANKYLQEGKDFNGKDLFRK